MKVPFVSLKEQYQSIKPEIDRAIEEVIESTSFIGGPIVSSFEREFSDLYGMKHCIGVGNGTDAIYVVLKMLGIGPGDEVITVANSWISTSETISQAGARPVFVDIDDYFTIDTNKIIEKITPKTRAIIPVHLYGQAADLEAINKICNDFNLFLIEDCAQAHFSEFNGEYTGSYGIASTFSFYPGKNLGGYGDGGAILTNDDALAEKCRMYANHGALKKHHHIIEGINSRLDTLQANILRVKLKHLLKWNDRRIENAGFYDKHLAQISQIQRPNVRPGTKHTYHLYVVKAERRDALREYLAENGVETNVHYPTILPLLPCYSYLQHEPRDFPVGFENQKHILSLPMYPELDEPKIKFICDLITTFYRSKQ